VVSLQIGRLPVNGQMGEVFLDEHIDDHRVGELALFLFTNAREGEIAAVRVSQGETEWLHEVLASNPPAMLSRFTSSSSLATSPTGSLLTGPWLTSTLCADRGTDLATATLGQIRLKLFKIGARIKISCRRIHLELASAYPYQETFWRDCANLCAMPAG
jgi:hypothetical protein